MRVLSPIKRHIIHEKLGDKLWRKGIEDAEIADVMRECRPYLKGAQKKLADSVIAEGQTPAWEGGRGKIVNHALDACKRESARMAEALAP